MPSDRVYVIITNRVFSARAPTVLCVLGMLVVLVEGRGMEANTVDRSIKAGTAFVWHERMSQAMGRTPVMTGGHAGTMG